ncbi:MAG: hypothetical protein QW755_02535 [Nitrososphaerota archaeon]
MKEAERAIIELLASQQKEENVELLKDDPEVNANWDMANHITVTKLK